MDDDLLYLFSGVNVAVEAGQAWMAEQYWERTGVMPIAESSGRAKYSLSNLGNAAKMAVAEGRTSNRETPMKTGFVCTSVPALSTVCWREKHHDWAKMAVEVALEACMQDGAVLLGTSLVIGAAAHVGTSSLSVQSEAVGQAAD